MAWTPKSGKPISESEAAKLPGYAEALLRMKQLNAAAEIDRSGSTLPTDSTNKIESNVVAGSKYSITLMSPTFLLLSVLILTSVSLLFIGVIKKNRDALIASLIVFLIFIGFLLFFTAL